MATSVSSMYDMVERMLYLYVSVVKARDLPAIDIAGGQEPYVELKLGSFKSVTWHLHKTHKGVTWRQTFAFSRVHVQSSVLEVTVKGKATLRHEFLGRVLFDLSNIPDRLPPDSPLAPQWYSLSGAHGERLRHGELMLAVWLGSQADEAFPEALTNRRSQVYYSPKLICLKVAVIAAQDLVSAEIGRPLAPTIAKIHMGSQIQRTRPGQPQGSSNQAWNEEFMFVASEPFEDPMVVTVEEKVAADRDELIGRTITHVAPPYVQRNDLGNLVPSKWFSLERPRMVAEAAAGIKHREHSKAGIIPAAVAVVSPHVRRNHLSRWVNSPAKWFRPSRSRGMSVDEAAADEEEAHVTASMSRSRGMSVDEAATDEEEAHVTASMSRSRGMSVDEAVGDVTASMTFASKINLRTSLETAYHVPEDSGDLQPAAEKLRKSAIGVLQVGILGARDLGDNKFPYCVAKYGTKWVRTRTLLGTAAPEWNESYTWEVFDLSTVITIAVFDNNHLFGHGDESAKDQRIGKVRVRLGTLESDRVYTHYYPLMALNQRGLKKTGELHLAVRFTCTAWADMMVQYGRPQLPMMHHTNPISVPQMDYLRVQATVIVAKRLGRADPPLPREVVECMLDVDSHMFSLRRSKANLYRITSLFSGVVAAVGKWFDGICKWKNPLTTILVHVVFLKLVCYPELILPIVFLCLIMVAAWSYCWRPRNPPHIDTVLSHTELAHPDELDEQFDTSPNIDAVMWWYRDQTYPDELDEEFDTFPTSKPDDIVRMRYERLRGIDGRLQTVVGDLATHGERVQSLLLLLDPRAATQGERWHDPRLTAIFLTLSPVVALVLYLTPFLMVLYFLRPPWFRGRTNLLLNLYSRLPSKDDVML